MCAAEVVGGRRWLRFARETVVHRAKTAEQDGPKKAINFLEGFLPLCPVENKKKKLIIFACDIDPMENIGEELMEEECVDIKAITQLLIEACHANCPKVRVNAMKLLDCNQMEELCERTAERLGQIEPTQVKSYLFSLIRLVDMNDLGGTLPLPSRQLAAILLKNISMRALASHAREEVRIKLCDFLGSYLQEPDCCVASQLLPLTAKLAVLYCPGAWKDLLCRLVQGIAGESSLMAYRSACTLHAILSAFEDRTDFKEICIQLFPPVAKVWAAKMKALQAALQAAQAGHPEPGLDCLVAFCTALSSIVRIIIPQAFPELLAKFACFGCFWQTYLSAVKVFCKYILTMDDSAQAQGRGAQGQSTQTQGAQGAPAQEAVAPCIPHWDEWEDIDYYTSSPMTNAVLRLLKTLIPMPWEVLLRHQVSFLIPPMCKMYAEHLSEPKRAPLKYLTLTALRYLTVVLVSPSLTAERDAFFTHQQLVHLLPKVLEYVPFTPKALGAMRSEGEEFYEQDYHPLGHPAGGHPAGGAGAEGVTEEVGTYREAALQLITAMVGVYPGMVAEYLLHALTDATSEEVVDALLACAGIALTPVLDGLRGVLDPAQWVSQCVASLIPRGGLVLQLRSVWLINAFIAHTHTLPANPSQIIEWCTALYTSSEVLILRIASLNALFALNTLIPVPGLYRNSCLLVKDLMLSSRIRVLDQMSEGLRHGGDCSGLGEALVSLWDCKGIDDATRRGILQVSSPSSMCPVDPSLCAPCPVFPGPC